MTTLTIMRQLPREVDPLVYKMSHEDPGNISYAEVGGLAEQIRELREVVELPLINPDLFMRVGITPPKGCTYLFGNFITLLVFRLLVVRTSRNWKNTVGQVNL
jgi:ATP-dependent 26S proteasome regulatory subunit